MLADPQWAVEQLRTFIDVSAPLQDGVYRAVPRGGESATIAQAERVEPILDRVFPEWPKATTLDLGYEWGQHREACQRAIVRIEEGQEIANRLGTSGPVLSAAGLHPWVWDAARPAWESGQYEDAIDAAARNVNSRTRAKSGRKDIGEGDLLAQLFSQQAPEDGKPRLRVPLPEHTADKTIRALHGGMTEYGKGRYSAVRNPLAHEAPGNGGELSEHEALETLAAFSLLARWIESATVEKA